MSPEELEEYAKQEVMEMAQARNRPLDEQSPEEWVNNLFEVAHKWELFHKEHGWPEMQPM